ncbi:protein kinase domain-containing protein [Acinetobacter terrestris]|uniref:Protein kinase n=1 Tax=Acinetobacter terrestris TaxID=2529843 RepID=A0AAW6UXS2_9GAMM|nr:protein kinase [Acinetobacter terrestris]MDK1683699.1 protein kinase [Acinetobacter terrestris]
MQFNAEDIDCFDLILNTKPKSLTFGRSLFSFEYQQQHYWLKTQAGNVNQSYEAGFLNELAFYQQYADQPHSSNTMPDFLLPFQVIAHLKMDGQPELGRAALILSHAEPLFNDCVGLSLNEIKETLLNVLDVVDQLHQRGWIHADLKREHFVHYQQRVCLIDFEQVQKINSPQNLQSLTATPRYMAPELFHAEEKTLQTDIYALGIIFYEWLTGQRLTAGNYQDWAYLHCQRLNIELPEHLLIFKKLLSGMLAKQKERRFTDVYTAKQCLLTENVQ